MTYAWDNDSTQNAHIKQMRDLNTCRIMGKEQSMGLNDVDTLKKDLKSVTLSNGTLVNTNAVLHLLEEYPTAFDVDKVVEQLEKKIQTHECCIEYEKKNGTITEEFQQRKAVEVLKDAIEIVKRGGKEQ